MIWTVAYTQHALSRERCRIRTCKISQKDALLSSPQKLFSDFPWQDLNIQWTHKWHLKRRMSIYVGQKEHTKLLHHFSILASPASCHDQGQRWGHHNDLRDWERAALSTPKTCCCCHEIMTSAMHHMHARFLQREARWGRSVRWKIGLAIPVVVRHCQTTRTDGASQETQWSSLKMIAWMHVQVCWTFVGSTGCLNSQQKENWSDGHHWDTGRQSSCWSEQHNNWLCKARSIDTLSMMVPCQQWWNIKVSSSNEHEISEQNSTNSVCSLGNIPRCSDPTGSAHAIHAVTVSHDWQIIWR